MTGDYTVDSAISRLDEQADRANDRCRELAGQLDRINEEAAEQRFSATSPNAAVTATVTGTGRLVDVAIAAVDRRRPRTEQLSAELTAAVLAARSAAAAEVGKRMKKVVPGFFED